MTAFAAATNALFRDRNLAVAVEWLAGGEEPAVTVRGVITAPDRVDRFGQTAVFSDSMILTVRVSEVAQPVSGDVIVIGADRYLIDGEPERDALRLTWRIVLVPEDRE